MDALIRQTEHTNHQTLNTVFYCNTALNSTNYNTVSYCPEKMHRFKTDGGGKSGGISQDLLWTTSVC